MRNNILIILSLVFITEASYAQSLNTKPYHNPEDSLSKWPSYPGGDEEKIKFLTTHLEYPEDALDELIEGKVIVGFTVEKDGAITDVHILRQVDPSLDEEALRVIKLMPRWNPGFVSGKPVKTRNKIDVIFKIPASYKNRKKMLEYNR